MVKGMDPENLRAGEVREAGMRVIDYHGIAAGARVFHLTFHPRIGFGERSLTCFTNEDGRRILKIEDGTL